MMQTSRSLELDMNEENKQWLIYAAIVIAVIAVGYFYMQS